MTQASKQNIPSWFSTILITILGAMLFTGWRDISNKLEKSLMMGAAGEVRFGVNEERIRQHTSEIAELKDGRREILVELKKLNQGLK